MRIERWYVSFQNQLQKGENKEVYVFCSKIKHEHTHTHADLKIVPETQNPYLRRRWTRWRSTTKEDEHTHTLRFLEAETHTSNMWWTHTIHHICDEHLHTYTSYYCSSSSTSIHGVLKEIWNDFLSKTLVFWRINPPKRFLEQNDFIHSKSRKKMKIIHTCRYGFVFWSNTHPFKSEEDLKNTMDNPDEPDKDLKNTMKNPIISSRYICNFWSKKMKMKNYFLGLSSWVWT